MNREIKYRAWDKVKKEFIDFNKIGFLEDGSMWYLQGLDEYENEIDPPYFEDDDTWVLLQFTGIKDKNGVEIYEGDVIEYSSVYQNNPKIIDEVIFSDGQFRPSEVIGWGKRGSVEIKGNIYENPELLEVSK